MDVFNRDALVELSLDNHLWERFYTLAPLVVIGTREPDGAFDLAPKHMAMPMGWSPYFGFVCTPDHRTYQNIQTTGCFTVSYPHPNHVLLASLAASPRCDGNRKPIVDALPTFPAEKVNGVFLEGSYLFLECEHDRMIDGFDQNSLVTGKVVAARIQEEALRVSDQDDGAVLHKLPLLAFLYPDRFSVVEDSKAFPFPKDFRK